MHYKVALNISYIENFRLRIYFQNWLWYFYSKFQICVLRSAFNFLARDTKLKLIGDQDTDYVSSKFQRNLPSGCWNTPLY